MKKSILVPYDFTEVGNYALEHAYMVGKASRTPISIIHIVKKTSEIEEAKAKLEKIAKDFSSQKDIEVVAEVRKGNLYKEIYKYGLEIDAYIAVMGTHGVKSVKKTLKVVKKFIKIPFILVQSPVIFGEYDRILIPIDQDNTARIKIQWIRYINTLFKSKVYMITYNVSDSYGQKNISSNIRFAENLFEKELIDYEIEVLESSRNFADSIFTYANEVESDLIMLMSDKYRSYVKQIKKAENLELYKKIPIMCVNKRLDIFKMGGFN